MPAVTRKGDADVTHCSTPFRLGCSEDVFVNDIGVSRQGDVNTVHELPGLPCPSHQQVITTGSTTVFVNNVGCGRIGDGITACTSVAQGSPDVFAGG